MTLKKMYSFIKYGKLISLHFIVSSFISLWPSILGIPKDKATRKPQGQGLVV